MSNEVVKYANDLNDVALVGFSKATQSIFMAILHKLREKQSEKVEFTYNEIINLANLTPSNPSVGVSLIYKLREDLISLGVSGVKIKRDGKVFDRAFNLFSYFDINEETAECVIALNTDFAWILNDLVGKGRFTSFELEEYTNFSSEYTQRLYMKLRQFRATGYYKVSLEEFKRRMVVPKSYTTMSKIAEKVLAPIQKDLGSLYNYFEIKKVNQKGRRGRPRVVALEFYFDKDRIEKSVNDKYNGYTQYDKPDIERIGPQFGKSKETNVPEWSDTNYQQQPLTSDMIIQTGVLKAKSLSKINSSEFDLEKIVEEHVRSVYQGTDLSVIDDLVEKTIDLYKLGNE
ncbi:MAG: replication initiation protein [Streptococcus salivarius]